MYPYERRYHHTELDNGIQISDRENLDAWIDVQFEDNADGDAEIPPWYLQCGGCGEWYEPGDWGVEQEVCASCLPEENMFKWMDKERIE